MGIIHKKIFIENSLFLFQGKLNIKTGKLEKYIKIKKEKVKKEK